MEEEPEPWYDIVKNGTVNKAGNVFIGKEHSGKDVKIALQFKDEE